MQFIKLVYESACKAIIRFWDNRFNRDTEVEYYRMEISQLRLENKALQDKLINVLSPQPLSSMSDEVTDWQPITSKYESSSTIRRRLEEASRQKARTLEDEARIALGRKSTEELEEEVGIN